MVRAELREVRLGGGGRQASGEGEWSAAGRSPCQPHLTCSSSSSWYHSPPHPAISHRVEGRCLRRREERVSAGAWAGGEQRQRRASGQSGAACIQRGGQCVLKSHFLLVY